jgi:hypothetical protein
MYSDLLTTNFARIRRNCADYADKHGGGIRYDR